MEPLSVALFSGAEHLSFHRHSVAHLFTFMRLCRRRWRLPRACRPGGRTAPRPPQTQFSSRMPFGGPGQKSGAGPSHIMRIGVDLDRVELGGFPARPSRIEFENGNHLPPNRVTRRPRSPRKGRGNNVPRRCPPRTECAPREPRRRCGGNAPSRPDAPEPAAPPGRAGPRPHRNAIPEWFSDRADAHRGK